MISKHLKHKPYFLSLCSVILGLSSANTALAQTPEIRSDTITPAGNGWEVCNETSYIMRVANAVIRNGNMTPKGWDNIKPGQ